MKRTTEILLVEDSPADGDLTTEILAQSKCPSRVHSVRDGCDAIAFLRRQGKYADAVVPDVVLLDLNLPRKDGRAVLKEIKSDPLLKRTPIVVFSTSNSAQDISASYQLGANSYICKPSTLPDFTRVVAALGEFWLCCALFPRQEEQ
jgi:two-component system, chemotaxis family, response regulator Rcp1